MSEEEYEEEYEEEEVEDRSDQIEYRLQMADYYRAVMMGGLFPGDDSPGALAVEAEMRAYAMIRSEVLLGLRPEDGGAVSAFTEQEVSILKAIAEAGARKLGQELPTVQPVVMSTKPKATVFQPRLAPIRPAPTTVPSSGTPRQDEPRKTVIKTTKKKKKQASVQKDVAIVDESAKIGGQVVPPNRIPTLIGPAGEAQAYAQASEQLRMTMDGNSSLLRGILK